MIKAEERFTISGQGYTNSKLLDQTEFNILIDMGVSKSYMLKSYYMRCKSLHTLSKCASTTQSSGRQCAICSSTICDSSYSRNTWT